ncbi:hypothetical protein [Streptococcus suis]|uniref:hypothetical protein n=1 Tax=Streptococcus suis TaxID=1307 RepID=UPI000B576D8E|nr:hypothetical protein [Streptococcus suis]ANM47430.1 hypothetical protein [Streptococcus phage phiJH1301-1]ATZ02925.1 hypothetical protein CVO91_02595 [Streptococcus suis]MBY5001607.1 hypothetical protein [Streptococcus suis]MBY5012742.1 hypothetical protein [Streptococcus suis]MBY5019481.1 hypothetical protein [Streptococcus suis]
MKKVIYSSLLVLSVATLVACSSPSSENTENTSSASKDAEKTILQTSSSSSSQPKKISSVEDVKTALEEAGLTVTDVQEKQAAIISAKIGVGYNLEDGSSVEVYEYEQNDAYNSIVSTGELLGMPATVIDNYVVIVVNETTHQAEIDAALNSLK